MSGIWIQRAVQEIIRIPETAAIIVPLVVDEMSEWYNSFVLLPKPKWHCSPAFRSCKTYPGIS